MRPFAVVYALAAVSMIFLRRGTFDPLPFWGVCAAAALLAGAAAANRPLVMLSAAHAGLTATWAGTLAAGMARRSWGTNLELSTFGMLMVLCAGMAALVGFGFTAQQRPQPQPVRVKSSRP